MPLTAIPLLDPKGEPFEVPDKLAPRTFVDLLDRHKALIFRRRPASAPLSVDDFGQFVIDCQLQDYPYVGGAAPRRVIPVQVAPGRDIVFTANERYVYTKNLPPNGKGRNSSNEHFASKNLFCLYIHNSPPDQPIPFHHELAQTPTPPAYIFFYCDVPAQQGGETPIIDSTAVYRYTAEHYPAFLTMLLAHGARYTRTLPAADDASSPIGRSYQNTWRVANREELDAKLATQDGVKWHWLDDGSVRITSQAVPAIRLVGAHAVGQNLIYQYVFANSIVAAYLGWQDVRNDRLQALTFGNGDAMPRNVLESIANFMQNHRVVFPWQKGDM